MSWSVLTPLGCAHWQGCGQITFTKGLSTAYKPTDQMDELWKTYYQHIFNPARVKLDAMRSEMPQKYWKHLPEAELIPSMVLQADARVDDMLQQPQKRESLRCGERPANDQERLTETIANNEIPVIQRLNARITNCRACELCEHATQAVVGSGPTDAKVMLVGEQPGDIEDLKGEPFVGPAGQLLDDLLQELSVDRNELYLTNAVKHFRFRPAGKRRIHERPKDGHIQACRQWLKEEIFNVQPTLIICLGVTATSSVLGQKVKLQDVMGRELAISVGHPEPIAVNAMLHPAAVLRSQNPRAARQQLKQMLFQSFSKLIKNQHPKPCA